MTIVIDHANPPVFTPRSNEPVVLLIDAAGSDETDATLINILGAMTIVYVGTDDAAKGVRFSGGEVGDCAVILGYPASAGFHVYDVNGDEIGPGAPTWRLGPYGWSSHS